MARLSRRALVVGAAGAAVLGCAGAGGGEGEVPRGGKAKGGGGGDKAPAPRARTGGGGDAGTLYKVHQDARDPNVPYADIPEWFRAAPGLWCPYPRTAGCSLLTFAEDGSGSLCKRIQHFRQLPDLLDQAEAQGTNLLYLTDWFEGRADQECTEFVWNKGEYLPRQDLGGAEGLKQGLAALKRRGGRALLYVEPFIFEKGSPMATRKGEQWSIRTTEGFPDHPYPDAWKLCPANPEFRAFMVEVAGRIVRDYGADGVHLDSFGFQKEWKCVETKHGHAPNDPDVFDEGCKTMVSEMLAEMRKHDRESVIMIEGTKFPALFRWVSACQDWGIHSLSERWAWRTAGKAPVFSAGWSLDDVHQILALGHRITIGADWAREAPQGTLVAALEKLLPAEIPDKKDERFRRFFAEDVFRRMHKWRNAGLLLGRAMPNIDGCTPRRWDRPEAFETRQGLVAIIDECRQKAREIDQALAGAGALPSLEAHYKKLLGARATFQTVVHGSELRVVETGEAHAAAYLFDGPGGKGATAVNVSGAPVEVSLAGAADGAWRELVEGQPTKVASGALRATLPPHSVRLWAKI